MQCKQNIYFQSIVNVQDKHEGGKMTYEINNAIMKKIIV